MKIIDWLSAISGFCFFGKISRSASAGVVIEYARGQYLSEGSGIVSFSTKIYMTSLALFPDSPPRPRRALPGSMHTCTGKPRCSIGDHGLMDSDSRTSYGRRFRDFLYVYCRNFLEIGP